MSCHGSTHCERMQRNAYSKWDSLFRLSAAVGILLYSL